MKNQGFTFIELMIAVGLVGIFVPAIFKTLSFALMEARQGEQFSQGWSLAREGMESIYAQKTSWTWSATSPSNGTTTTSITPYTRTTAIAAVQRCSGAICTSGGTVDLATRKITVMVTWPNAGPTPPVILNSYVTQH